MKSGYDKSDDGRATLAKVVRDFRGHPETRKGECFIRRLRRFAQIFLSDESAKICAICGQKCLSLEFPGVPFSRSDLASRAVPEPHGRRLSAKRTSPHRAARCRLKSLTTFASVFASLSGLLPLLITPGEYGGRGENDEGVREPLASRALARQKRG